MINNLDRLKPFYHIYTSGSVGSAAEMLHVTQPAVSQALHKLEEELGTQLFIRRHRRLIPTRAGDRLYGVVKPFFLELEALTETLDRGHTEPHGELAIGAPPEFGKAYLPAIAASFRRAYPAVTFRFEFALAADLMRQLSDGTLELALVDLFLAHDTLAANPAVFRSTPAVAEEIILAGSARYCETRLTGPLTPKALLKQDFIEYTRTCGTVARWFSHHYGLARPAYQPVITVDSHDAVIACIMQDAGLGVVASHLIQEELARGDIRSIETDRPTIVNTMAMVSLRDRHPTLTERVFSTHFADAVTKLGLLSLPGPDCSGKAE